MMSNDTGKQQVVIYHASCPDGFTAAWAAWENFGDDYTDYVPAQHDSEPPNVAGRDVVIVDFSYDRDTLQRIHREARSLIVLDHHLTAEAALHGLDYCVFDMERSGAGITWDYYHGRENRPWLVDVIEDRDLWRWAIPHSRAACEGIDLIDKTFEAYHTLAFGTFATPPGRVRERIELQGNTIMEFVDVQVQKAVVRARKVMIGGFEVPCVNSSMLQSEIGHALVEVKDPPPFGAVWFERRDGMRKYSLRSLDHLEDVSAIAKLYGGGGHRNAAGFTSDGPLPEDSEG